MENITEQVAQLIRDTRTAKGMTQKELAESVGIDGTTMNRFENGKQNLSIKTLQRIAEALSLELVVGFK